MFMKFIAEHQRSFSTKEEFNLRADIFKSNLAYINDVNARNDATYTLAVNKFADMTKEEFKKFLGRNNTTHNNARSEYKVLDESSIPDSIDWRVKGGVNFVQDQGQCGSCWAFSATAGVEGAHFVATGQLLKLSEQQVIDCVWTLFSWGCSGGEEVDALNWAKNNSMIISDSYPSYNAETNPYCMEFMFTGSTNVKTVNIVTPNNVTQLLAAITQVPTTVAVDVGSDFQFYSRGILNSTTCGTSLDHAIAAVGFNQTGGYYIVRNSWGQSWGENGYIRMAIVEGEGMCGIQKEPAWATAS